jgi:2-oxoglutarate ferredoxin oxidoreductase subunit beta
VTFNDHEGSTKSYEYTRQHFHPAIATDYIHPSREILAKYDEGEALPVSLHDGSQIILRKAHREYDPTDRAFVYGFLEKHQMAGEIITGLLYYDDSQKEMHDLSKIVDRPLSTIDYEDLCPGQTVLQDLQQAFR